ncbi:signal peptide containing protein [Theileria equi strain WA]|uniref:Signal peptide containing protein n=1 Tax=Theileria equi strain WA TaxID=1537102 RepID=L1LA81_THEEQ|nr:signal peptide containing protein [Theileria equi strain WA]EKX72078.1 signal peptide containing protein [Theileria equi strain WA]|eukprot:XP_004831530.1 signal peptide containing protein [Theileria equi strain WA]
MVFSILLVTCLLGLCHCRRSKLPTDGLFIEVLDDYVEDEIVTSEFVEETKKNRSSGQRLVWDLANGTVYEAEYTQSLDHRRNGRKVEDVAVDETPVTQTSRHTTTLNIAKPDEQCNSFDYTFTANRVKLIVPKKNTTVIRLVDGEKEIWIPSTGETFGHARVYLSKDGKAELVLVVTKRADTSKETYIELNGDNWMPCNNHEEKMRILMAPAEWISDFELDLSLANSTNECSIFEADLLGITTKHFYPKPGYLAKGIRDSTKELWKAQPHFSRVGIKGRFGGPNDDYCLSCLVYKKGDKELMEMITVENLSEGSRYFERVSTEWISVEKDSFLKKLDEMRSGS